MCTWRPETSTTALHHIFQQNFSLAWSSQIPPVHLAGELQQFACLISQYRDYRSILPHPACYGVLGWTPVPQACAKSTFPTGPSPIPQGSFFLKHYLPSFALLPSVQPKGSLTTDSWAGVFVGKGAEVSFRKVRSSFACSLCVISILIAHFQSQG